jgi:hypothetical protein
LPTQGLMILFSYLHCLQMDVFPSGFPTKTLYAFIASCSNLVYITVMWFWVRLLLDYTVRLGLGCTSGRGTIIISMTVYLTPQVMTYDHTREGKGSCIVVAVPQSYHAICSAQSQAADRAASPLCTSFNEVDLSMLMALSKGTDYWFWAHTITCGEFSLHVETTYLYFL